MSPDRVDAGEPREWLRRAKSNLERARATKPDEVMWEDLCFDAQQAAEKALKALLLSRGVAFPKVHDIRALLMLLSEDGLEIPESVRAAMELTVYAFETRYPGTEESVTEEEFRRALSLAEVVFLWAERLVTEA